MAINSVSGMSNVAFKASAMDKVSPELLSNPGAYSQPSIYPEQQEAPAKRGSLLGGLVKLVAGAVIIAGVAVAARKLSPSLKKIEVKELGEKATFGEKFKNSFAKITDAIFEGTIGKLKNLFKGEGKVKEGEATPPKTDGAPKTTETPKTDSPPKTDSAPKTTEAPPTEPPKPNEGGDGQNVDKQA